MRVSRKNGKLLVLFILLSVLVVGCSSTQGTNTSSQKPVVKVPYYEGQGGKGIKVAVLQPSGKGLSENEQWLLSFIQGSITGDFSKYSAMTVIDRQNLDQILANQAEAASGIYSDDDYISIGHITNAQYIVLGNLTKTSENNYILDFAVTEASSGERKASFPPQPCSYNELQNLSVIKNATEDKLNQLGIELTDSGKQALSYVNISSLNAETALSKGITAQKNGTVVEALSYFYSAASFDNSLKEVNSRLSKLSTTISSGSIGEGLRNDIQRRNEWITLLNEANAFFNEHLPYEIIYDPTLTQGAVDYHEESVNLSFNMVVKPTDGFKIVQDIRNGLFKTGKVREWGFELWPMTSTVFVDAEIDSAWNLPGQPSTIDNSSGNFWFRSRAEAESGIGSGYGIVKSAFSGGNRDYGKAIFVEAELINEKNIILATAQRMFFVSIDAYEQQLRINYTDNYRGGTSYEYVMKAMNSPIIFSSVKVNDITDNMTVKIVSVNDVNADEAEQNGYIKISVDLFSNHALNTRFKINDTTNERHS